MRTPERTRGILRERDRDQDSGNVAVSERVGDGVVVWIYGVDAPFYAIAAWL